MISIENLTFIYPNTEASALKNVSLRITDGDFALVMGVSGAGKSTLLRALNGLVPHFSGGKISGKVTVNQVDPIAAGPQVMSRHVGFVFQDPEAQFVMDVVEDELAFALENAAIPRSEMRIRVEEALDLLDLSPLRARRLETLSGGEKQRVAIAAALALRPRVLALDEPTSQLDPKSAEDVLQSLVRLNADLGLTIVLAEHRLERVLPFVDTIVFLPDSGGARTGIPADILPNINLVPPLVALAHALGWHPLPLTIKAGKRFSRKMTLSPAPKTDAAPVAPSSAPPLLRAAGISAGYSNHPILENVDFSIRHGEIVAVMGRNGAGKTTLLKSLMGLLPIKRGKVVLNGENITGAPVAHIARTMGYLPQDPNALLFADTVLDEVTITLKNHGLPVPQNGEPVPGALNPRVLLRQLGLSAHAGAYPRDLSVGERQRVALAAITVTRPQVLLLDEPTRGLDYHAKETLAALLRGWQSAGMAIVLVTHDVEFAAQLATRVVLLSQGEIIADGAPAAVLGSSPLFAPQVARLFPESGWLTMADALSTLQPKTLNFRKGDSNAG